MQDNVNKLATNASQTPSYYDTTSNAIVARVSQVLDTEVDRKSFLLYSAGALVALTGIGSLTQNLKKTTNNSSSKGFGSGSYGGQ